METAMPTPSNPEGGSPPPNRPRRVHFRDTACAACGAGGRSSYRFKVSRRTTIQCTLAVSVLALIGAAVAAMQFYTIAATVSDLNAVVDGARSQLTGCVREKEQVARSLRLRRDTPECKRLLNFDQGDINVTQACSNVCESVPTLCYKNGTLRTDLDDNADGIQTVPTFATGDGDFYPDDGPRLRYLTINLMRKPANQKPLFCVCKAPDTNCVCARPSLQTTAPRQVIVLHLPNGTDYRINKIGF